MLCQKCEKNEAEVHFVQNINGEKTEALLCGNCAAESGFGSPISFTNFLQGFINAPPAVYKNSAVLKCDTCGLTLNEIKEAGKAGCADCYKVFRTQMETIIRNVQAGNVHTGKFPKRDKRISMNREINELKRKLAAAVETEEYEEAARLRDAIKALKEGEPND